MRAEEAMRCALRAARRSRGEVHPNPPVGAAVVRGDRVLATGRTRPPGGPHAEVVALERARRRHGAAALRGASLAVTLEPCTFVGRTPPCTEAILASGVRRVWVGQRDPHPRVDGAGLRRLRRAGLEVRLGVLADACEEQHRGWSSVQARGRPFVALKLAATLDGRIATRAGESRWITGPAAREVVHGLRARADAVVVGVETALHDDPELTARRGRHVVARPIRVVFDTELRLRPAAGMLGGPDPERVWVVCGARPDAGRRRRLETTGARVLPVRRRGASLDVARALARLAREGLTDVLVEGGGTLGAALLRSGCVDEIHWFASPSWLGGDAQPALGPLGLARLRDRIVLDAPAIRRVGEDLYLRGRVRGPEGPARGGGVRR